MLRGVSGGMRFRRTGRGVSHWVAVGSRALSFSGGEDGWEFKEAVQGVRNLVAQTFFPIFVINRSVLIEVFRRYRGHGVRFSTK